MRFSQKHKTQSMQEFSYIKLQELSIKFDIKKKL